MIKQFFSKPYRWAAAFSVWLACSSGLILLDAFVIPRAQTVVIAPASSVPEQTPSAPIITATSYQDGSIEIAIETLRIEDTDVYIADIRLTRADLLRTAFAQDTFGRNIKAATSQTAATQDAILAINGDNYGARDAGFVVRNGILYREASRAAPDDSALLIDAEGNFHILHESETETTALTDAWQVFTFGPALLENGALAVDGDSEVVYSPHANVENPRTAIGQVGPLHYLIIVADGRTQQSEGLTLLALAELLQARGCQTAYNLDGGGSSTLVFMGEVLNRPSSGRRIREREINDIVYIGYT